MRLPVIRKEKKNQNWKTHVQKMRKRHRNGVMASWILFSTAEHKWDKASTETLTETLAVLPDWQNLKDLYMSDGRIAHFISISLQADGPGVRSNLIRSHGAPVAIRLAHTEEHPLWAQGSTGEDTELVRNKSFRASCRHSVRAGKTFTAFITGCAALIQGRWGIDDNFRVQKLNLHPGWF